MLEINIDLKPSRYVIGCAAVLMLSCLIIACSLSISFKIKVLLSISIILYSFNIVWNRLLLRERKAIQQVKLTSQGYLLRDRTGQFSALLLGESTVTTTLCILRFQVTGERFKRTCMITRDLLSPEHYRSFYVSLQCVKLHGVTP